MLLIDEILISDDLFEVNFTCNLAKCKGACCWEGDYGAPLTPGETEQIRSIIPALMEMLPEENQQVLNEKGPSEYYVEPQVTGTSLMPDASCVYLLKNEEGVGICAIEKLHAQGRSQLIKPISCALYPVRLIENEELGFIAMNYDKWDICQPACSLGEKRQMPVFRFVQKAIIRKFGQEFYDQMEGYYEQLQAKNRKD